MAVTLAEVLRRFGPEYLRAHSLSTAQAKAWRAIVSCRTEALGGQLLRCDGCGREQWRWHSCRNRHCPQCQAQARDAWRQARLRELLDVPYCHLVFTLPHELNALAGAHPRWVYETLMQCVAATLSEFAANPRWLGGIGAFTLVLHTWTQDLRRHLHVHALMACGALGGEATDHPEWIAPRRGTGFLFPVQALSRVFRGKFLAALRQATLAHALPRDPVTCAQALRQRECGCASTTGWCMPRRPWPAPPPSWTISRAIPTAPPSAMSACWGSTAGRCTCGCAAMKEAAAACRCCVSVAGAEFVGRLLQHVLPLGFKRIRHYGVLAPAAKQARLSAARRLLQMPQPNPKAVEDASAFMRRVAALQIGRCGLCANGHWQLVCERLADRSALARVPPLVCRGPP
jgi:hypothetical protein